LRWRDEESVSDRPEPSERRAEAVPVAVIVERQAVDNPWADHRWVVVAILPGTPEVAPWTMVDEAPGRCRYFAGIAHLRLYPRETETLKYNLESREPAVYVFLRRTEKPPGIALIGATACPGEAHAHADTGNDQVEPVAIPPEIAARIADFVARHHVERPVWKRQRDTADPEALGIRSKLPAYPWDEDE
jgi:hypothetical protein